MCKVILTISKGVLLGTGPIVDPGFEGNLFIPLHNLTGNKYIIKKGASLIRVEFTKLSTHTKWSNPTKWEASRTSPKTILTNLGPITKSTPKNARFSDFIEESLLDFGKKKFYTSGNVVSVRSSIPDAISEAAAKADEAHSNAESSAKDAKAAAESSEKLEEKIRKWSVIGAIGVGITLASLLISTYALIQDTTSRYDGIMQEIKDYKQQIYTLEQKIEMLQEKLGQYEITQSQSSDQSQNNISDETVNSALSSSN